MVTPFINSSICILENARTAKMSSNPIWPPMAHSSSRLVC